MARSRAAALAIGSVIVSSALASASSAVAQSPPPAPETIALGDWQLAPALQVRTRGEYWRDPVDVGGGVDSAGSIGPRVRNSGGFLERSRLGVAADRGAVRVQLTLQDARAWGVPSPTATLGGSEGGLAAFGAYEAFLEAHSSAARPSFLRVGRQAVVWGDGRLLGNADWSPTARTLDAARAHLSLGTWDFELLASILATTHPLGSSFGDTSGFAPQGGAQLYAAQVAWTIDPLLVLQAFAFAKSRAPAAPGPILRGASVPRGPKERRTPARCVSAATARDGATRSKARTRWGARRASARAAPIAKHLPPPRT